MSGSKDNMEKQKRSKRKVYCGKTASGSQANSYNLGSSKNEPNQTFLRTTVTPQNSKVDDPGSSNLNADRGTREILTQLTGRAFTPPKLPTTSAKSSTMASPLGETSLLKEAPIFEGELLAPDASELSVLVGALDQAEPNPDRSDDDVGWDKEEVLKSEKDVWERADKELRNIREFTDPTIEALVRLWRRQEPAAALTCLLDAADNPTNGRGPSSIASWLNVLFLQQKFTVDASYGKAVLPSQHHTLTSQALAKTYSATPKASNISVLASAEIDCMREIKRQLWDKGIGPIPEIFEVQVSDKGHLTPSDIGTKARRRMKLKEKGKCSWRRAVLY